MDDGAVVFNVPARKKACKCHYERLLNVENKCEESLPNVDPVE